MLIFAYAAEESPRTFSRRSLCLQPLLLMGALGEYDDYHYTDMK